MTDIKEMCLDFARFHREWAAKVGLFPLLIRFTVFILSSQKPQNLALWEDAKAAIDAIEADAPLPLPKSS